VIDRHQDHDGVADGIHRLNARRSILVGKNHGLVPELPVMLRIAYYGASGRIFHCLCPVDFKSAS
jgi:hypothetical protein